MYMYICDVHACVHVNEQKCPRNNMHVILGHIFSDTNTINMTLHVHVHVYFHHKI